MHPKYQRADELSHIVIGAAIEVHRHLGPGLIESVCRSDRAAVALRRGRGVARRRPPRVSYCMALANRTGVVERRPYKSEFLTRLILTGANRA